MLHVQRTASSLSLGVLQFVGKLCDLPCRPLKAPVLLKSLAKALFHGASMLLRSDALCRAFELLLAHYNINRVHKLLYYNVTLEAKFHDYFLRNL